jgi:hypothetical protein
MNEWYLSQWQRVIDPPPNESTAGLPRHRHCVHDLVDLRWLSRLSRFVDFVERVGSVDVGIPLCSQEHRDHGLHFAGLLPWHVTQL